MTRINFDPDESRITQHDNTTIRLYIHASRVCSRSQDEHHKNINIRTSTATFTMSTNHLPFATAVPFKTSLPEMATNVQPQGTTGLPRSNESEAVAQLLQQGFTSGLAVSMTKINQAFPYRIWVVDNSGSIRTPDGQRIVETISSTKVVIVAGTRWEELCETVKYHIKVADLLQAPTCFRLMNPPGSQVGPQNFVVAAASAEHWRSTDSSPLTAHDAIQVLHGTSPGGGTPLTAHIHRIHDQVKTMAPALVRSGGRCVIVVATDGLPTDELGQGGDYQQRLYVDALKSLEGLPIWLVIRLCTDDDEVVKFYNSLDEQLELSIDVLDDLCAEALEVVEHNKWLNYGLPLHRCREMGFHHRVFDIIDERPLTKSEVREFLQVLLGDLDGIPDPSIDWLGFSHGIEGILKMEKLTWNPVTKKMAPWIDMQELNRKYGDGGCACAIL